MQYQAMLTKVQIVKYLSGKLKQEYDYLAKNQNVPAAFASSPLFQMCFIELGQLAFGKFSTVELTVAAAYEAATLIMGIKCNTFMLDDNAFESQYVPLQNSIEQQILGDISGFTVAKFGIFPKKQKVALTGGKTQTAVIIASQSVYSLFIEEEPFADGGMLTPGQLETLLSLFGAEALQRSSQYTCLLGQTPFIFFIGQKDI